MAQNAKDTDSHIGRRLKLRDLQILASVAQHGSMAKAAAQLSTTQPTVSQAIADLEDAVGVKLRLALLASGDYISCIPGSVYRYGAAGKPIKALPVDMALRLPVAMLTLRNRTLSPAVKLFIETARDVATTMAQDG